MITMDCERVEDELSGYLDDVLDPQLQRNVGAHLATCVRCRAILDDFRRADELIRAQPFIEPLPDMREQFFNSPRYLKLTNQRAHPRNFVTPLTAALVAAAMLVLVLGGALLFRQGLFVSQQTSGPGRSTTIGNPGGSTVPLPAGPRLIYERGGALWSAPESGAGLPRQLTPAGVEVAGWSVSPNGRMVLYIAARTGALHTIRADALNDTVVGTVTGGKAPAADFWISPKGVAIASGIAWSPDNTRIAYVAQSVLSSDGTALHVMNATGAADTVVNPVSAGQIGHPLWSADSVYIAYTVSQPGTQSLWVYNVTTGNAVSLAAHSDASDALAVVGRIAWLPGHTPAAITWSTKYGNRVTGVFRANADKNNSAVRLTPAGTSYTAADVSASGAWLLAEGSALAELAAGQASPQVVATVAHPIAAVYWSPSGQFAVVASGGALAVLTPGHALVSVADGLSASSLVAWSPQSDALAWRSGNAVKSAQIHQGVISGQNTVAQGVDALALVWSPDGQSLAVRSSAGLLLVTSDGLHVRATDSQATSDSALTWSVAG